MGGSAQRTFLTTDPITLEATYFDPNAACAGPGPVLVQWFLFNLEGVFQAGQLPTGSDPFSPGSKHRLLFLDLGPGSLAPGSYRFTFLVRDCTNTESVVLPEMPTFGVVAP